MQRKIMTHFKFLIPARLKVFYGLTVALVSAGSFCPAEAQAITVSPFPAFFAFTEVSGGAAADPMTLNLTTAQAALLSGSTLQTDQSWLTVSPSSIPSVITGPLTLTISVKPVTFAVGSYSGNIKAAWPFYSFLMPVKLSVTAISPLTISPGSFTFTMTEGGTVPSAQKLTLSSAENGFTFKTDQPWLNITPSSVSGATAGPVTLSVSVTPGKLAAGTYSGHVILSQPSPPSALTLTATLTIAPSHTTLSYLAAYRFLSQASWGPSPASIAHLQQIGIPAWFNEQKTAPFIYDYSVPQADHDNLYDTMYQLFNGAINGQDQLHTRMMNALYQLLVVSGLKENGQYMMDPYLEILYTNSFGNYRTLLQQVTISPYMGFYLDMVDSFKANPAAGTSPNENYGREVMQVMSIGDVLLNQDGTPKRDISGATIPTYTQSVVADMARALSGWTYPSLPNYTPRDPNPPYFAGPAPMIALEWEHDTGAKTLLNGAVLPASQPAATDVSSALDLIFSHPNAGPFLASYLIKYFVTSNPSPQYVTRVANVFNNNGTNTRGDLWAVLQAILTDAEARACDAGCATPNTTGHLKDPELFISSLSRMLNPTQSQPYIFSGPFTGPSADMGQNPYYPPSVFSFYSPSYAIPKTNYIAPEFQLINGATAWCAPTLFNPWYRTPRTTMASVCSST